jgi:superoxide dismutase
MISTAQRWDRIVDELQKATQSKFPKTGVMCKDKWNSLNFDFKKLSYYQKGTGNHTYFWDLLLPIYLVNSTKNIMKQLKPSWGEDRHHSFTYQGCK